MLMSEHTQNLIEEILPAPNDFPQAMGGKYIVNIKNAES